MRNKFGGYYERQINPTSEIICAMIALKCKKGMKMRMDIAINAKITANNNMHGPLTFMTSASEQRWKIFEKGAKGRDGPYHFACRARGRLEKISGQPLKIIKNREAARNEFSGRRGHVTPTPEKLRGIEAARRTL